MFQALELIEKKRTKDSSRKITENERETEERNEMAAVFNEI